MKILAVSDREYKKTSRGIDIITSYLADKGHYVDHLVFFKRKNIPEKQVTSNLRQLYFYDFIGLYRDKMRLFLPGFLLKIYFSYIIKNQKKIDFSSYEWIILESGYSSYLGLVLNNKIIFRISDPPEIAFNSNRIFYKKLENSVICKAIFISSAISLEYYSSEYKDKIIFWHSGFIPIPNNNSLKKKEFVFMGGGEIDLSLIKKIAGNFPDYIFHIIGSFKNRHLPSNNVIFHGYLEYSEYQKLILSPSVCVIPFSKRFSNQLRNCDFTAKIFLPVSLGMPVLLKSYGKIQKTDINKKLFVYKNHKEALELLESIILKIENGEINFEVSEETKNFLNPHTAQNRLIELDKTLSEWIR